MPEWRVIEFVSWFVPAAAKAAVPPVNTLLAALDMHVCVVWACAATAEAAALAVESLINSGSIGGSSGVTGYVDAASGSPAAAQQLGALVSLRTLAEQQQQGQSGQLLTPHEALMW
jgi:hypothetical protein